MFKRLALCAALTLAAFATTELTPATVVAAKKAKRRKAKRAKKAKRDAESDAAASAKEAAERKSPAQFSWTERPAEGDMDERADRKRDEAIAKLKKLIPTIDDGPQKADLYFRLSEMYWAKSKYKSLQAMQQWDTELDRWNESGARGPEPKLERIPEYDQARAIKAEALKLYRRILAKYERYDRKDEVLYNLGNSLYESGDKDEGVEMYWTLIKQFPKSRFTPDAWLQLGEHFFNANRLANAQKAYSKAMEASRNLEQGGGDEARVYSYALYKLAWCDFNMQEYVPSLEKFNEVIEYAKKQRSKEMSKRDRIQLYEESLSDMVRVYSHLDAFDEAFEFYQREVGKEGAYSYLHRLARRYDDEGKFGLEIKTYARLNSEFPDAAEAPGNQTAIMNAFAQLGRNDDVRKQARRLIDLYSPGGSWWRANEGNENVQKNAYEVVERELASLVVEQHRAAQQTKLVETYKLARDLYKEYLSKFTNTENSYKFTFFYAEILFELKQFQEAAEAYARVVSERPKGEFTKNAAYTAILAWEKVMSGEKETLGKKIRETKGGKAKGELKRLERIESLEKGEEYAAKPLTEVEQKLADACDRFVEVAPKDEEVVKVHFKSARLYFINNQFEEAAKRFELIISQYPRDPLARTAAESVIESFNVRKDWTNLNTYARKVQNNRTLMADKKFALSVQQFIEGAAFNEILYVYEPKSGPKETADRYVAFVDEFPKSSFAMVALYNAIVNYDKANVLEKSMASAKRLLTDYEKFEVQKGTDELEGPKVPVPETLREKTLFQMATFHARLAEMDEAVAYYDRYVERFPKGPNVKDALFNAALLREGLGQNARAVKAYERYLKAFPQTSDRLEVAWHLGEIHENEKNWKAAETHFASFGRVYGAPNKAKLVCASYKAQQARQAQGEKNRELLRGWQSLYDDWKRLPEQQKSDPCALEAAGAAAFEMLEPEFQAFLELELVGSERQVQQRLIQKLERVDALQKQYTQVLAIGAGDYGIAALYRIGRVYQDLARGIYNSQCPRRLTEDQCMMYEAALQEQAFPLEEKAIEAYNKALEKAYELGLYNDWLAKTSEALKVYQPGRFPQPREYELIASETAFEAPEMVEVSQ